MTISTNSSNNHRKLPLLAVRDVVVYPYMQIALFIGRTQSTHAIELAQEEYDGELIVVSQKDSLSETINPDDLYQFGTRCRIISTMPHDSDDKCLKVLIEGLERVELGKIDNDDPESSLMTDFWAADIEVQGSEEEINAKKTVLLDLFADYADGTLRNARELSRVAGNINSLLELMYFVATRTQLPADKKQQLLQSSDSNGYFQVLIDYFSHSKTERSIESQLQDSVRKQMENNQREYFLNEKMKAIKSELSDLNNGMDDEDGELESRLKQADLPDEVRKKAESEFKKLKMMPATSSEASVVRGYVEWILDTPWNTLSKVGINLDKAKQTLDQDHYGLDDVKDRILEYLAVQSRVKQLRGPILCLVGPPGVGKTSLGESIARATGRKFVRMALGGVRDEAEIRGHRRTYIGAMPGKIVQSLSKVGVKNPLFLLDEIDKMAQDFRGDPASALLEVLDPSQNKAFNDHYLDLDLDLSQVMFICTANSMNIPPALLDRMEVIRLPGYTEDEKLSIAKNYLTPKAIEQNGLKADELEIQDEAIMSIIRHYTREAGVRNLEREINKISRKAVRKQIETYGSKPKKGTTIEQLQVNDANIADFLGVKPYDYGLAEKDPEVGRITGLAWTSVGGELLTIEAATMQGKGELVFTGSLGDVMKESIRAAMSVVRAGGERFGIEYDKFKNTDLHIHMPEGATPKDGPSAGIALTTAIVSAMTGIAIRADIAMTGEVTLRGKVLRIGGLKEKLLAAHRGGIKQVLIPKSNERDLVDIPDNIKDGLIIQSVETIDEVLAAALVEKVRPLPPTRIKHEPSADTVRS
ncbi:ATP-dependent proteinase. Serine peptidase. MEROPS family S16 [Moraxella cuniculi DSM 21768]|uniref:Lon protease n=1 Tax=Moraxella cuniculi DSM 21768 TaxID=1122245 RepID=A0A1N7EID4_9GAMM|nr:endopeptidase La [Moraxella cuniculi]OOS07256.1 endopeptidase La [Moraxella cuniculi]SIR87871.1 ATP-dependent proteinase. Serine peptidase. MEROPS family S16 [Moraxella cuniculi DSM 21768]